MDNCDIDAIGYVSWVYSTVVMHLKPNMRDKFFFIISLIFWFLMVIGFSDNWLFDTGQESNSQPKFLIHAFFAFSWFTLLVVQTGLIRKRNYKLHMKLGLLGIIIYYLLTITIWNLFFENFMDKNDWMRLVKPLEAFSIVLVTLGFLNRKKNTQNHKDYIIFGTFCLIGPALDRTVFHLFGPEYMMWPMLILTFGLFGSFIWYKKKFTWYMGLWLIFWTYSLYPLFSRMF